MLVEFVKRQQNLKTFDINGIVLSESSAYKILNAFSQAGGLVKMNLSSAKNDVEDNDNS